MSEQANVIQTLEAGLRATGLRSKVIAGNIANLNTPGYRRAAVEFEKALSEAISSEDADELRDVELPITRPMNTPVGSDGNDVDLDVEVGELVKNSAAYKTYIRLLAKAYKQMDQAMESP